MGALLAQGVRGGRWPVDRFLHPDRRRREPAPLPVAGGRDELWLGLWQGRLEGSSAGAAARLGRTGAVALRADPALAGSGGLRQRAARRGAWPARHDVHLLRRAHHGGPASGESGGGRGGGRERLLLAQQFAAQPRDVGLYRVRACLALVGVAADPRPPCGDGIGPGKRPARVARRSRSR